MSLSRETMMDLMAYADGELDAEARARVEALVASSEEARRVVAEMGYVGDWVRAGYRVPESPNVVDDVMQRVDADKVVDFVGARRKRRWMGIGAGAVAAAAAWMLVARQGEQTPVAQNLPDTPSSASAQGAASNSGAGVDVEQVESAHQVSVFFVPAIAATGSSSASTVVVWIAEEERAP
jgi:anti-sigma factor RsiW